MGLKILKITPARFCRLHGSLQIIRQASEKIKTGLGFDIVYADDVRSVITACISFVFQPDSNRTGICDVTIGSLDFQNSFPIVIRNRNFLRSGTTADGGEVVDGFIAANCLIARP